MRKPICIACRKPHMGKCDWAQMPPPEQIFAHLKTADAMSQVRRTLRAIREVA